jgi:hypothetical protein
MAIMPDGTRRYIGEGYTSERAALKAKARLTAPSTARVFVVRALTDRKPGEAI